jgi:hypothetical protein
MGAIGCGSNARTLPIPIQEASQINRSIMESVRDEVDEARFLNLLRPDAAYTNMNPAVTITGSFTPAALSNTIHATVQIRSLSFQIGSSTYLVVGVINYDNVSHQNGESTTTYSSAGNFTLSKGLSSWECRWPHLELEVTLDSDTGQLIGRPIQGSYVIDGVTYSYSRS